MEKVKTSNSDILTGDDTRYDTAHDVNMRLCKTIVRFEGRPVYIKDCMPDMWTIAWDLSEDHHDKLISANDKRLDISSPPLGYINHVNTAVYVMRTPMRSQKQGLDAGRLGYHDVYGGHRGFSGDGPLLIALGKSIRNEYPSLEEGFKASKGFAISKTWGFSRTSDNDVLVAFHRQYPVALFRKSSNRFVFQKGALTTVRRTSLQNILVKKGNPGANYRVEESA